MCTMCSEPVLSITYFVCVLITAKTQQPPWLIDLGPEPLGGPPMSLLAIASKKNQPRPLKDINAKVM